MSTWYYQWLNIHCGKWTLWNRSTWVSTWKTRHWVFSVGDRFILWHWKPNIAYPPYIWFITFTLLDFHYIITDHGDLTRPTKRQLQINMITALPPTEPAVTSEIKSWFSMFLSLVLDASRLVSSPLGLWGAGWIVRFDWVVCEEKMSGKKIWLIEWERAVRVILASSPATAESRASEQSKAHIFKTNHFFMVTFSASNYYLLTKEFMMLSMLTHYW